MLEGKTILITGASRGIGAAAAAVCSNAGARVIAHASKPSEQANQLIRAHDIAGGDLIFEDLSALGAGGRLVAKAQKAAGYIDCVVNNAGIYLETALTGDEDDWVANWQETITVNIQAPADICRAAIKHFRERGGGRIINIASRAGHRGDGVDHAGYAASKGAVLAMTKTWARALSGEGILLYAIAPGWVETRMAPQDIENRKKAVADIPLGRVAAPEEIGNLVAFLLSDSCLSATGSTFDVNGASYVR